MKKLLILSVFFFSCSKEEKTCWKCSFGFQAGGSRPDPVVVCIDPWEQPGPFRDANGNDLSYYCEKLQ